MAGTILEKSSLLWNARSEERILTIERTLIRDMATDIFGSSVDPSANYIGIVQICLERASVDTLVRNDGIPTSRRLLRMERGSIAIREGFRDDRVADYVLSDAVEGRREPMEGFGPS